MPSDSYRHTPDDSPAPTETSLYERLEAIASEYMGVIFVAQYICVILIAWVASWFFRVPREVLEPGHMQWHWVPVLVHSTVSGMVGAISYIVRKDMSPCKRLMAVAVVLLAPVMILGSVLVEVIGQ